MSTCWHGKEGVCEICLLITGEGHLVAVEKNGKNGKNGKKEKDN